VHPRVVGSFVSGEPQAIPLLNAEPEECLEAFEALRARTGRHQKSITHWPKPQTKYPSIQGKWRPDAVSRLQPTHQIRVDKDTQKYEKYTTADIIPELVPKS